MFHTLRRSRATWAVAACLAAAAVVGVAVAAPVSNPLTRSSDTPHGSSAAPQALPALAGRTIRITETVSRAAPRDNSYAGYAGVTNTVTWAAIDDHGLMTRFRSTTTGEDGNVQQDQLYEDGSETVNTVNWMGTGQSCSEVLKPGDIGSGIPTVTAESLTARGFRLAGVADGAETWTATGPDTPGYESTASEVFVDAAQRYDLGSKLTGTLADGSSVTIYSRTVTIDASAVADHSPFTMEPFPPCTGHNPSASS